MSILFPLSLVNLQCLVYISHVADIESATCEKYLQRTADAPWAFPSFNHPLIKVSNIFWLELHGLSYHFPYCLYTNSVENFVASTGYKIRSVKSDFCKNQF